MGRKLPYSVELHPESLAQHEEHFVVLHEDGRREQMRLHEYGRVYAVPGLYEEVVQHRLECASPSELAQGLAAAAEAAQDPLGELGVFDVGAGNGVVGEELRARGVGGPLVGLDTVPEAATAAERDRPGQYAEYLVAPLSEVDVPALVERHGLRCLAAAGALGSGHISPGLFDRTWSAFPSGSWLAATVSEEALSQPGEELGDYVDSLRAGDGDTRIVEERTFRHRLRMSGEPIDYRLLIAQRD